MHLGWRPRPEKTFTTARETKGGKGIETERGVGGGYLTDQGDGATAAPGPCCSPDAVNVRVCRPRHLEVDHRVHSLEKQTAARNDDEQ